MPIRIRLAALFELATLAAVAGGGYLFVHSLRHGLETSLDTSLRTRADTLTQKIGDTPGEIDFQDSGRTRLLRPQDAVAQVLDPAGRVVEASEEAGTRPFVNRALRNAARSTPQLTKLTRGRERYRVLVTSARRADGPWTVVVASSLESADNAVARVIGARRARGAPRCRGGDLPTLESVTELDEIGRVAERGVRDRIYGSGLRRRQPVVS